MATGPDPSREMKPHEAGEVDAVLRAAERTTPSPIDDTLRAAQGDEVPAPEPVSPRAFEGL
ncbi:MAG: hypothetical protein JXR14_10930 [Paracoccaceae bacterium]